MKRLLLPALLVVSLYASSFAAETRRPNVILFLIDDQDKNQIGAFGGKTFTPNLDRMAAEAPGAMRALRRASGTPTSSTTCAPTPTNAPTSPPLRSTPPPCSG